MANKGETPLHVVCAMFPLTLKCCVDFLLDGNTFWYPSILSPRAFSENQKHFPLRHFPELTEQPVLPAQFPRAPFPLCNLLLLEWTIPQTGIQVDGIWYKKDVRD